MKLKFTHLLTTSLLFIFGSASADNYTLSDNNIDISTPGSHTITGSGSGKLYIHSSTDNSVFNITLNNINLTATQWASAIVVENTSSGSCTINFILVGDNYCTAGNHGGIECAGTKPVNVVFTTETSGTFTISASYASNYSFQNDNGNNLNPSIDSGVNCTLTLASVTRSDITQALSDAFGSKPLVLSLSKIATGVNEESATEKIIVSKTSDGLTLKGLENGTEYIVYKATGTIATRGMAQSDLIKLNLPKGFYIIKTAKSCIKIII
jgi:hypothetical protein